MALQYGMWYSVGLHNSERTSECVEVGEENADIVLCGSCAIHQCGACVTLLLICHAVLHHYIVLFRRTESVATHSVAQAVHAVSMPSFPPVGLNVGSFFGYCVILSNDALPYQNPSLLPH